MARPTKLTPELQELICDYLANGVPQYAAAAAVGITSTTLDNWKRRGRDAMNASTKPKPEDAAYVEFLAAVELARGRAEAVYAMIVRRAADADAKVAMWWLDRAHPENWAQRQEVAVSGAVEERRTLRIELPTIETIPEGERGKVIELARDIHRRTKQLRPESVADPAG